MRITHTTGYYRNHNAEECLSSDLVFRHFVGALVENVAVDRVQGDDILRVTTSLGDLVFFHRQDCCESVGLEDGLEDLRALVGDVITSIEEVSSEGANPPNDDGYTPESYTWTFYKTETRNGTATLRFLGMSNGYYSEDVDVRREVE